MTETIDEQKSLVAPELIMQAQFVQRSFQVLITAVEVNLFEPMEHGSKTSKEIAGELNLDERVTASVLNALVAMKFLHKQDNLYQLTDQSRTYLLRTSDLYMGLYLSNAERMQAGWSKLSEVLRTGKPVVSVNQEKSAQEFFPALAEGIFPLSYVIAQAVARRLDKVNQGPFKVLDVAAGSAVWSIPIAEANQSAAVDALDFESVLAVAKKTTSKRGLAPQYNFIVGDWRNAQWKTDHYDLVTLGHILHSEGREESKKLLKQCFAALKPAGRVVVAEFLCDEDRTSPLSPLIFELNMYMHTDAGCVFTVGELEQLLRDCGFRKIEHCASIYDRPVLLGIK